MTEQLRIPTNLRTLLILEVMSQSQDPMSPTEINDKLGLPKQTVHRLVATLEREGFLIREHGSNRFRPSRRLRLIGAGLLHASQFHITRHQILKDVSEQVKETVNFVVPEETGMHYLDRVETDWPFRVLLPRGSNVPFHCTASGKVFLGSLSKTARQKFVNGLTLKAYTANSHTDAQSLLNDIEISRKRGYSIDSEEYIQEMVAIAVPVVDTNGRFVAALAIHGPKQRLPLSEAEAYHHILSTAAQKLTDIVFD